MTDNMLNKLKNDLNLVVLFSLISVMNGRIMAAILWFLVMAAIQDGWQHVQVEDWPKLSIVWFSLQLSMISSRVMVAFLWFLVKAVIQGGMINVLYFKNRDKHEKAEGRLLWPSFV